MASGAGRDGGFSDELESLLYDNERLTIGTLTDALGERSLAILLMLLMIPSALPLPTGGVTHVLDLITVLVAAQMIAARRELWLPQRLMRHELSATFSGKAVPAVIRRVRWVERFARPRFARLLELRAVAATLGLVSLVFVVGAFVAPPFTGLDTLPALGVVVACLGLVFADGLVVGLGVLAGVAGIALEIALGSVVWSMF
jgi:hypothetical protein